MNKGIDYLQSPQKRALDVLVSSLFLAPGVVVSGMGCIALSRELGGIKKSLILQKRKVGEQKTITVPKLRTLSPDKTDGLEEQTFGTFDHRAEKIGRLIRQSGIDEVPQIANVLMGNMSMAGPRPLTSTDLGLYQRADPELYADWFPVYSAVPPGLCGPSQMMRHGLVDTSNDQVRRESMKLDLQYVEGASFSSDLEIIANTPVGILRATNQALSSLKNSI